MPIKREAKPPEGFYKSDCALYLDNIKEGQETNTTTEEQAEETEPEQQEAEQQEQPPKQKL